MDNGARSSVTNMISILRNVRYFDKSYPDPVRMKGATSKDIVIPEAEGKLRVQADAPEGFIDVYMCSTVLSLLLLYYQIGIYYLLLLILLTIKNK